MKHTCSTLIIHCIDFRFQSAINDWLYREGFVGDYDELSVAGSCKDLLNVDERAKYLFHQIATSEKLHHIKNIILMNHTDCGAYGGSLSFSSLEEEKERLKKDILEAASALLKKHSTIGFRKILAVLQEDGQVVFVEFS